MKPTSSLLSMLLAGSVLVSLWGCGGGEPPKPAQKAEKKEVAKPAPKADVKEAPKPAQKVEKKVEPKEQTAPTKPQAPVQGAKADSSDLIDFASLKNYPDLAYTATESEPGNGDVRCALMDGARPLTAEGKPAHGYWCAPTPAQMEIALSDPKGACWISSVEVEGTQGDYVFSECSINIKTQENPAWHSPEGLMVNSPQGASPGSQATGARYVFSFTPVAATHVQITVTKGGVRRTPRAYVRDIDVLGVVK
ncbi:MAG: hypothetical protein HUU16_11295 [Candidatus Omnitrophica bacterium]|nr:hypothetical protein [Candidatus Omnitrophota bacterium]